MVRSTLRKDKNVSKMTAEKFIESKEKQFLKEKNMVRVEDIGRQGFLYWKREAWTFLPQSNYPEKCLFLKGYLKIILKAN